MSTPTLPHPLQTPIKILFVSHCSTLSLKKATHIIGWTEKELLQILYYNQYCNIVIILIAKETFQSKNTKILRKENWSFWSPPPTHSWPVKKLNAVATWENLWRTSVNLLKYTVTHMPCVHAHAHTNRMQIHTNTCTGMYD